MACIFMFVFKQKSRNAYNNRAAEGAFFYNYHQLFGLTMPHMDTVNVFFRQCSPESIEAVKHKMIQYLLEKKVLHKLRFLDHFMVAVDGTGIHSYDYEPWEGCPYKESKKGKKTWQVSVLEAKIVCSNGFAISLGTEWTKNNAENETNKTKQDCERNAFIRLSERIKKEYPRLPIMILADGLYPYEGVFNLCEKYNWQFLFTFKDGNLKTLWETVEDELLADQKNKKTHLLFKNKHKLIQDFRWLNQLTYNSHRLNWVECIEKETKKDMKTKKEKKKETRFVHLSSIEIDENNVVEISRHARMRWKIENEGFNTQKNHGYNLEHKFSRYNNVAMQNYYQCMQIAHIINQLAQKEQSFQQKLHPKDTYTSLWQELVSLMMLVELETEFITEIYDSKEQLRY